MFYLILTALHFIINTQSKYILAQNKDGVDVKFEDIKPFARFIRRLRVDENSFYPDSFPLDCRLFYVSGGRGKIKVENKIYNMEPKSVLYINSGVCYKILPCDCAEFIAVNFDFTFNNFDIEIPVAPVIPEESRSISPIETCAFDDIVCFNNHCFYENFYSLQNKFEKAEEIFAKKLPLQKIKLSFQLGVILADISQKYLKRGENIKSLNIESIVEYISKNYMNSITNESLGKIFHFHPNYISSEFKRTIGKPLHQYVIETRILNSVSFMEEGKYNLNEIAVKSGFNDFNYFSRCFKKYMGIAPSKYLI